MKMKNIQAYPINNVPDHLVHECGELGRDIIILLGEKYADKDSNILLGALTLAYATIIKSIISDDPEELKKAAFACIKALIKNLELLAGHNIFGEEDE